MQSLWETQFVRLNRAVQTLRSQREYERIRARSGNLDSIETGADLSAWLRDATNHSDRKDVIYRDLVEEARCPRRGGDTAFHLIWLGLWPGLDASYHSSLRLFRGEEGELVAAIIDCLTAQVYAADLSGIHRLAATFVRNIRRDVQRNRVRELQLRSHNVALDEVDTTPAPEEPNYRPVHKAITQVGSVLVSQGELDLVTVVLVDGLNLREAAEILGITHAAARRRFKRALERLNSASPEIDI
jgi:RNA polymerase sigma-70 factor (ECF subfamily)